MDAGRPRGASVERVPRASGTVALTQTERTAHGYSDDEPQLARSDSSQVVHLDQESATDFYGKFTCEPLERGFGVTIGNSLRRVLLASLQGAAITAVRIDGALHEFTTIPDVVEDVTDIILNLKDVVFKAESPKTYTVRLEKEGPGRVTAGDIKLVDGLRCSTPTTSSRRWTRRARCRWS